MSHTYAILYLEINLFSVILLVFIRCKTLGISRMFSQRNFSRALDSEIVFILSDTLYVMMKCGLMPYSTALVIIFKTTYFFSTALMCYYWFIYFELLQGSVLVKTQKRIWACSALVIVMGVLLTVNLFTGILFYVDADGVYQRGPLFILQYLISYIYVIYSCFRALIAAILNRHPSDRKTLIALALFPIAPAGAGIIQFIYPELPVACAALSIATLIMYQMWIDQMIAIDPLTKLNNRKQLCHNYEQWQNSQIGQTVKEPMHVLLIDADKFKSINDNFGHIEGDRALVMIADALRAACAKCRRRAQIARYGGDEFIILARDTEADIAKLCRRIHERLAEQSADCPYKVSVSIGTAAADRDTPLQNVIAEADKELYEQKHSSLRQRRSH